MKALTERCKKHGYDVKSTIIIELRMVAPRGLMHREGGTFEKLPAYDLAMQSDTIVVLDHDTDVFFFVGC